MASIIDTIYDDTSKLIEALKGDLSLQSFANGNLRKVLLLSAASWFETRICDAMAEFAHTHSNGHPGITSFVRRKGIDRQYHTYFNWKDQKPGPFFALFGDSCGDELKRCINGDPELKDGIAAFLELGNLRNELVHENFAAFSFEKTAEEVHQLYCRAEKFVRFIEQKICAETFGRSAPEAS